MTESNILRGYSILAVMILNQAKEDNELDNMDPLWRGNLEGLAGYVRDRVLNSDSWYVNSLLPRSFNNNAVRNSN